MNNIRLGLYKIYKALFKNRSILHTKTTNMRS